VEPIPETREAVEEFGPFTDDEDLLEELIRKGERVRAIVPTCVGLSLALKQNGVTFTLVASAEEIAALDALQYLEGGPCVEAAENQQAMAFRASDPLDERQWQLFAQGTAATGVACTLSLPILADGHVAGTVNLYAAPDDAFTDHHNELAAVFDAWAPGAVTNADLSFSTRQTAEQAPQRLREDVQLEVAAGVIASRSGVGLETAREQLRAAARRAGLSEARLAEAIIDIARLQESE
jgi:transcriptional regulator with GAF, ATPase, and Fis domain